MVGIKNGNWTFNLGESFTVTFDDPMDLGATFIADQPIFTGASNTAMVTPQNPTFTMNRMAQTATVIWRPASRVDDIEMGTWEVLGF